MVLHRISEKFVHITPTSEVHLKCMEVKLYGGGKSDSEVDAHNHMLLPPNTYPSRSMIVGHER